MKRLHRDRAEMRTRPVVKRLAKLLYELHGENVARVLDVNAVVGSYRFLPRVERDAWETVTKRLLDEYNKKKGLASCDKETRMRVATSGGRASAEAWAKLSDEEKERRGREQAERLLKSRRGR